MGLSQFPPMVRLLTPSHILCLLTRCPPITKSPCSATSTGCGARSPRWRSAATGVAGGVVKQDRQLAYAVILRDRRIDELEKEIDRLCLEFIVRQQPVAKHLRFAYIAIKINQEIERIGDYAESIAKQVLKLTRVRSWSCRELPGDRGAAIPMLRDAARFHHGKSRAGAADDRSGGSRGEDDALKSARNYSRLGSRASCRCRR